MLGVASACHASVAMVCVRILATRACVVLLLFVVAYQPLMSGVWAPRKLFALHDRMARAAAIALGYETKVEASISPHPIDLHHGPDATIRALANIGRFDIGKDAVTFKGFYDALYLQPAALFGSLLAACQTAETDVGLKAEWCVQNASFDKLMQAMEKFPATLIDLPTPRDWPPQGAMKALSGKMVFVMSASIINEIVSLIVFEGVRSRLRYYPNAIVIIVDNGSPEVYVARLEAMVSKLHNSAVVLLRNFGPSRYEQGAYHTALQYLDRSFPEDPNEVIVFTQATTVLMQPLPKFLLPPGCKIRRWYTMFSSVPPVLPCGTTSPKANRNDLIRNLTGRDKILIKKVLGQCPGCQKDPIACFLRTASSWGAYGEMNMCGKPTLHGLTHSSFVARGVFAREVLRPAFADGLQCKIHEQISSYWALAGGTSASCDEPIDKEYHAPGLPNNFIFKIHPFGFWQEVFRIFFALLHSSDVDFDGAISGGELMQSPTALRAFCNRSVRLGAGHQFDRFWAYIVLMLRDGCNKSKHSPRVCHTFAPACTSGSGSRDVTQLWLLNRTLKF
mmetsp:Transcript_28676/g.78840  ORF Transcript_28676/g.78840 Transcript_28676/m.78840 type:complete len:562 (+) Transcript_28676:46-1731(+)